MKVELFPFQKRVLADLRLKVGEAIGGFREPIQIKLFFTAPTGAGKTIIMASLIEDIFAVQLITLNSLMRYLFGCQIHHN